jgi:hypothetical protein
MALAHFQRTFTDTQGNVKPGLAVTVRRESDNGLAALFADAGSVTPKSNPFNTDANGYGSFYVTDGRYRIQATDIDWRDTDIFISPTFYAQLAGGPLANFTAMPQVGGDPIVESGSNADGEFTRWADGTQICTGVTGKNIDVTTLFGPLYRSSPFSVSFAANFVTSPNMQASEKSSPSVFASGGNTNNSGGSIVLQYADELTGRSATYMAIGRWY